MSAAFPRTWRGHGWRVLVVDAERELVDRALSNAERCEPEVAAVRVARTGAEAILLARDFQPDLLLLDPDLPDVNGWALLQGILRDVRWCEAVIVSRRMTPEDFSTAMWCGARGYIMKPFGDRNPWRQSRGCIVSAVDVLSDLLAPAPPLGPRDGSLAQGQ